MPEFTDTNEKELNGLGWYKVGLSIDNVKFIIQEILQYPDDPVRIRVLIEQAVKGTILGPLIPAEIPQPDEPLYQIESCTTSDTVEPGWFHSSLYLDARNGNSNI